MARLASIRRAYRMSTAEEKELAELFAFEMLIESTGEDREFGEAVLSVLDLKTSSSIYVIGGRQVALTSSVLQAKAAKFLKNGANMLAFFYPKIDVRCKPDENLWFHNTEHERIELKRAIQASSKRPLAGRMRFFEIDTSVMPLAPIVSQLMSLCGPFTATTVTNSVSRDHGAGYVYVEGPRDRWVLLKPEHASRALRVVESAVAMAQDRHSAIREMLD
ncbi:MAG: hypothetical protein WCC04_20645 [Terriglobales bacterium]